MRVKTVLAENLKNYRKMYNLSQEMVAMQSAISIRGYGKLERGEVSATLDTLEKLSCGLGIPIEILLSEHMQDYMCVPQCSLVR